ncbi:MAG: FeoB-associated Cys-rich membrane protein [Eubacteriales bacterium]|nr:FeoB-associated Cys-rich membrane protein [Eubacteriales bacterium]
MIDWIIGIIIVAAAAAVVGKKVKDAREGKPGCGCGCAGCRAGKSGGSCCH